jgi:hypothetical protein
VRPALVPIRLRDLRLNEEFWTSLRRELGRVIDWGHVIDVEPRTGRMTRVRACLCRFGIEERIHSAELVVLVPFDRPHCRHEADEDRWSQLLRQPQPPGVVRAREVKLVGPRGMRPAC